MNANRWLGSDKRPLSLDCNEQVQGCDPGLQLRFGISLQSVDCVFTVDEMALQR